MQLSPELQTALVATLGALTAYLGHRTWKQGQELKDPDVQAATVAGRVQELENRMDKLERDILARAQHLDETMEKLRDTMDDLREQVAGISGFLRAALPAMNRNGAGNILP